MLYKSGKFNKYKWIAAWANLNHSKSSTLQKHKNMQEEKCGTVQDWTTKINVIHFRTEEGASSRRKKWSLFLMADRLHKQSNPLKNNKPEPNIHSSTHAIATSEDALAT